MKFSRLLLLCAVVFSVSVAGCGVKMQTRSTAVPNLSVEPSSIFVISNSPNLDKYMSGVGRKSGKRLVKHFRSRGLDAWFYDQGSLNLNRKSVRDSLDACRPEAVLILNEKLGLLSSSWGSTSVKEFEIESILMLGGSDKIVWQARTTGKVSGSRPTTNTYIELAEQILVKLIVAKIVPGAQPADK